MSGAKHTRGPWDAYYGGDESGRTNQRARSDHMNTNKVLQGYISAALLSSDMDKDYDLQDIKPEAIDAMRRDCERFLSEAEPADLETYTEYARRATVEFSAEELLGHDIWLTRNRCGEGFWSRGWLPNETGIRLTSIARTLGECDLYVDGEKIHIFLG